MVIENATDTEQVRLFLPSDRGCAAIVTSSQSLAALGAHHRCELGPFSQPDGVELFRKLDRSPRDWTVEDPGAKEVMDWCEGRPAEIASVGAWMSEPHVAALSLTEIVARLRQGGPRADVLKNSKLSKSLQLHEQAITQRSPEAARLFRLLGVLEAPDVDVDVVTALAGRDRNTTEQALEMLVNARLLEKRDAYFRMPRAYRPFAQERARAEEGNPTCRAALERALRHYLERKEPWATERAAIALEAIDRLPRERTNLVTAAFQAFEEKFYDIAWRLSVKCAPFFNAHRYFGAWEATARIGVDAAGHLDQMEHRLQALAFTHANLGNALYTQGQPDEETKSYEQSVQSVNELVQLGLAYAHRQHLDSARACLDLARNLAQDLKKVHPEFYQSIDPIEAKIVSLKNSFDNKNSRHIPTPPDASVIPDRERSIDKIPDIHETTRGVDAFRNDDNNSDDYRPLTNR